MAELYALTDFRVAGDPDDFQRLVIPAVQRYLQRYQNETIEIRNIYIRRLLYTVGREVSANSFRPIEKKTLFYYINTWTYFVLYLLRAKKKRNRLGLKIDRKILSCLNRIEKLARTGPRPGSIFIDTVIRLFDVEINRLNVVILQQRITKNPIVSFLIYYLEIVG